MGYQVLARKWRPRNFSTLVGQEHVVRALTHALNERRLHHAYLFTGTRGVGKTTIARILAKSLNCETGVSANPCGHCSACQEIDAGRFVDLLEVDAATNTRVEEMRQLLENAVYAPTRGRYKVYVIDEVHMLSTSAFNAMLKTLEEPPEHVKFILATTDPQKIPVTVLSRCLQFNLKQMPVPSIVEHMGRILGAEDIAFETEALHALARAASGSMRDALSLLDQAIAHGAGRLEAGLVRDMLGTVDAAYLLDILEALAQGDGAKMLAIAEDIQGRSLSCANALQELAVLLTRLQVLQLIPGMEMADSISGERLVHLTRNFSPDFIQLAYQIVTLGRQELPLAPDEYSGFVMVLLRLLAFAPVGQEGASSSMVMATGRRSAADSPSVANPRAQEQAPSVTLKSPASLDPHAPAVLDVNQDWHALVTTLNVSGMARELAQHCDLVSREGALCLLQLSPAHRHLLFKPAQDKLQQALAERLGQEVQLRIEIAEVARATPAQAAEQHRRERQEMAIAAIEADPFVRDAIETFDASLVEASIKPID
ncbi:DNA polymerase III subunit gamma/tau [Azovibrio restrictus]|uniref:DNA polymerase III subunit gamma/tau n=1 Tax=Azovibrio restrictus TaxID=146938 RepID=UPI0026EFB919|nr:DNA polymerase III subunit gamma/tau [Azovibrio restrictus]MDD3483947.1 DNA polymerase III subunit gamma/tau [Azovibrio restrictus]